MCIGIRYPVPTGTIHSSSQDVEDCFRAPWLAFIDQALPYVKQGIDFLPGLIRLTWDPEGRIGEVFNGPGDMLGRTDAVDDVSYVTGNVYVSECPG